MSWTTFSVLLAALWGVILCSSPLVSRYCVEQRSARTDRLRWPESTLGRWSMGGPPPGGSRVAIAEFCHSNTREQAWNAPVKSRVINSPE